MAAPQPNANYKKLGGAADKEEIKKVDSKPGCSNPWSFKWMDEKCIVKIDGKDHTLTVSDCIKKMDVKGKALCRLHGVM